MKVLDRNKKFLLLSILHCNRKIYSNIFKLILLISAQVQLYVLYVCCMTCVCALSNLSEICVHLKNAELAFNLINY